jgi:hypothetical protein
VGLWLGFGGALVSHASLLLCFPCVRMALVLHNTLFKQNNSKVLII